ncbi:MAG: DUF4377 domain-containing protein [Prevotella sp.]|nr:DUF4377 domain-containing protein [Prevotella sp.]
MEIPTLPKMDELKTTFKTTDMNIKYLSSFLGLLLSLCTLSCTDDNDYRDWSEEKVIEISSEIVPVNIFGEPSEVDGMLVRIDGENQWKAYPITIIEGFEFESGYLYTLKVKIIHAENPPQDDYNVRFKLLSLISKTKVNPSSNL